MKLKALIADDEPLARERLRLLLSSDDEVEIAGECRNGREVIAAVRESPVDLLFLDIQMPGIDGFEVFEQIGPARMPVTVFVTAHNRYALKAFEVHALDYLVKPIEPERLQATLDCVKERVASRSALAVHEQLRSVLSSLKTSAGAGKEYRKRLVVPSGTKDVLVSVDEIEWIEAADYYACIHVGSRSLMLRETIRQLSESLDPGKFVRIHRSVIVNIDQVREILREGRGEGAVLLASGRRLKMSKAGWQSLLSVSRK